MGDFNVRKITDAQDRRRMYQYALGDIAAFDQMLHEQVFDEGPPKIGAEQELCLVDRNFDPASLSTDLLPAIDDDHYTNELALFNLEINLDPLPLEGDCFSKMESGLLSLLQKGRKAAAELDTRILMAGILPTLKYRHLQFDHMTPIERYRTLSSSLSELRGSQFDIHVQGLDEVIMSLGTVLFEACNTSFQLHLQVAPSDFVSRHNWSQMIAGPVLSACANSSMLFGNELWAETRIALFKQSLDTRSAQRFFRRKLPRVYFGDRWLRQSPSELWKADIMRFPLIVTSDNFQDAQAVLSDGRIPDLRAIRLHNGTTYTWNRLCYGPTKPKPHLRIECRYLPAGPSVVDEIANLAFWVGLMCSDITNGPNFWKALDFKEAKSNFIRAARTGLNTVFRWFDQTISAVDLILEHLIPKAYEGLDRCGVDSGDAQKYLSIVERRIQRKITGASWTTHNFRRLVPIQGEALAEKQLIRQMLIYQEHNIPLCDWKPIDTDVVLPNQWEATVEQFMSTDIFALGVDDSIEVVRSTMDWNGFHHLPIEDASGNLVGLITDGMINRLASEPSAKYQFAKDIMLKHITTVRADELLSVARRVMYEKKLSGLPVVYGTKLIGILTTRDLQKQQKLVSIAH